MSETFSYAEFTTRNIGFVSEREQEALRAAKVGVAIYRVGHTSDTAPWSKRRSLEAILVRSFT
jgi:hypothetical protein